MVVDTGMWVVMSSTEETMCDSGYCYENMSPCFESAVWVSMSGELGFRGLSVVWGGAWVGLVAGAS